MYIYWILNRLLLIFLFDVPSPSYSFKDASCPPNVTTYCLTGRQQPNALINGEYSYEGCYHDFPYFKNINIPSEYVYITFNNTFNYSVIEIKRTYTDNLHYALCFEEGLMDCNKQWLVWNGTSYHQDQDIYFGSDCSHVASVCNADPNQVITLSVAFDTMNISGDYALVGCYATQPYFVKQHTNYYLYYQGTSRWYIGVTLGDNVNYSAICRSTNLSVCASNQINFYDPSIDDKYLTKQDSKRIVGIRKTIQYIGIPIMSIYVLYAIIVSVMEPDNKQKDDTKASLSAMDTHVTNVQQFQNQCKDIKWWLQTTVGLEQYTDNFLINGYERFDIIMDITDAKDLLEIGITSETHQTQLLSQISFLKSTTSDGKISENRIGLETVTATEKVHKERAGNINNNKKQKSKWKRKVKLIAKCIFALLVKPCLEIYDYYTDIKLSSEWVNDYDYGFGHGTACKVDLTLIAVIMLTCSTLGFVFGVIGHFKMVKQSYFANKRLSLSYQSLSDIQRSVLNYFSFLKLCIENMVSVVLCLTVAWDKIGTITTTSWFLAYYSSVASLTVSIAMFIRKERKAGCNTIKRNKCFGCLMPFIYCIFFIAPAVLCFLPLASLSDMHTYKMAFAVNSNGEDVYCGMHNSQYNHGYDWWYKDGYINIGFDLNDAYRITCAAHEDGSSFEYINGMRCNVFDTNSESVLCAFSMMVNECAVNNECGPYSDDLTVCFGYPGSNIDK